MSSTATAEKCRIKITGPGAIDEPWGFSRYEKNVVGLNPEQGKLLEAWLIKRMEERLSCISINKKEEGKTRVIIKFEVESERLEMRSDRADETDSMLIQTVLDHSLDKLSMHLSRDWWHYTPENFFTDINDELSKAKRK